MGELYKYLAKQSDLARQETLRKKTQAQPENRPLVTAHGGFMLNGRTISTCYVLGYCSKKRVPILYVCKYTPGQENPWRAMNAILYETKAGEAAQNAASQFAKTSVGFVLGEIIPCPACGIKVKNITVGGQMGASSAFICSVCDAVNCYGSHRVAGQELIVTCGKCGDANVLSAKSYKGEREAMAEAPRPAPSRPVSSTFASTAKPVASPAAGPRLTGPPRKMLR